MLRYDIRTGAKKIKTKTFMAISGVTLGTAGLAMAVSMPFAAKAAGTQVVVTPTNTQGWTTADTRLGGAVNIVSDSTAPGSPNAGALQLTTDTTTTSKAQYMHDTATSLSSVTELSYSTKQNSASFAQGDASYQLAVCLTGATSTGCNPGSVGDTHPETSFTTFVFEPYENGTVSSGWQTWNVATGQMWSSRTVTDPNNEGCAVLAGGGGAQFYTLAGLQASCPDAVVVGFGVNIGSNNPSYNVEADLVDFNGTTYNFEPYAVATDKDSCKNGGWAEITDSAGHNFKNQGDCVSYVATGGRNTAAH